MTSTGQSPYIIDTFDPELGPIRRPLSEAPLFDLMQMAMSGIKEAEDALIEKGLDLEKILKDTYKSAIDKLVSTSPDTDTESSE